MATLSENAEHFLALEEREGLWDRSLAGCGYWQYLRVPVFYDIATQCGQLGKLQNLEPKRYVAEGVRQVKDLGRILRRYDHTRVTPADLLFLNHTRHYPLEQRLVSPYTHFLLEDLPATYWDFQFSDRGLHHVNDGLERVLYLDALYQSGYKAYALLWRWRSLRGEIRKSAIQLERTLRAEFGVSGGAPRLDRLIWNAVRVHNGWGPLCDRLLERARPRLIVNVVHYSWPWIAFTLRARQKGIPVAELQHGAVSAEHIAYRLASGRSSPSAPDYFLSFGKYWSERVSALNLPAQRTPAIGFAWLEARRPPARQPRAAHSQKMLLVLSQSSIGVELSRFVALAAPRLRELGWSIVYRLHPGETHGWSERMPWLLGAGVSICQSEVSLYERFSEATAQLGVYSTALYEGLAFGLPTLIARLPGSDALADLVDVGVAHFVSTPEELAAAVSRAASSPLPLADVERFWEPAATRNFRSFVRTRLG